MEVVCRIVRINTVTGVFLKSFQMIREGLDVIDVVAVHMKGAIQLGHVEMKRLKLIWILYMRVRRVRFATRVPMQHLRRDTWMV